MSPNTAPQKKKYKLATFNMQMHNSLFFYSHLYILVGTAAEVLRNSWNWRAPAVTQKGQSAQPAPARQHQ